MKTTTRNPLRFRNVAAAALGLGILAGIWLGDLFKGFGLGPGQGGGGSGTQSSGQTASKTQVERLVDDAGDDPDLVGYHEGDSANDTEAPPASTVVKVLIDDRNYYVRDGEKQRSISLEALVDLIRRTEANEDGLRAVVDRTNSSRVTAEVKLFEALKRAGVSDNAVYLTPQALE